MAQNKVDLALCGGMDDAIEPIRPVAALLQIRERTGAVIHKLRMHHVLFVAFTLVAALPVMSLSTWVQNRAVEQQIEIAKDTHLLVARNLTAAFSRYVFDVKAGFGMAISSFYSGEAAEGLKDLLTSLEFHYLCILDGATGEVERYMAGFSDVKGNGSVLMPAALAPYRAQLKGGETLITDLGHDIDGRPAFFLLRALPDGRVAYGVIGTEYLVRLQRSIAFGAHGHAVVLDASGRVVGHPVQELVDDTKDLSELPPVKALAQGKSGVMEFYSPAQKAEMITAYTQVPETRWGILVPQPMDELYEQAGGVRRAAMTISFFGMLAAGLISWVLAKYIAQPLRQVGSAAVEIANGNLAARAPILPAHMPSELRDLSVSFNVMVDEISRKNVELANTASRAEAANRAKSEFLANMSHELRTPLNAIQGFSEIMRDGVFGPLGNDRYQAYAADINNSALHLMKVIGEILDLSKAGAGMLTAEIAPVNLPDLVDLAIRLVEQRAASGNLTLKRRIDPLLGNQRISSDSGKLTQILLNLLTNAVKFTPAGGTITVTVAQRADAIEIVVADTGIGIAANDIANVMTPFGQVKSAYQSREGFGLGLPLSKKLTEALGGELVLESVPGNGTSVTVWLPNAAPFACAA